ncbi:phage major capsid protein [Acetivibrio saccincola]|uniref:phage major capsid protein n=1 Tax=Acetivibrio saccincola TaxID=1677857 RepID=UPI0022872820|nr:phage major capsid protein [Acetivibrio saccincola]
MKKCLQGHLLKAWAGTINGTGEGQPLGIINDPALITVDKEDSQSAATITYQNVVNMFSRLAPSCFTNAVWLANPSVIPQLLTMTITIGTGGAQIPVFREESGKFTLLGKEVLFTEKCPALGAKGDLILADLSQYTIGMRKEIALDRSNVPGWMEDMTDYRVIVRVDGQGTWDKPITPKNGATLSWAVALEAR